jgi:propionate catabolism operon transcriptional regulator
MTEALVDELVIAGARYPWPGNVRELENFVERIATFDAGKAKSTATPRDRLRELIPEIFVNSKNASARSLAIHRQETELQVIERVLQECGGDRRLAAERLGIGRTTLWRKISGNGSRPRSRNR